jgi:hypothetical protein
MAWSCVWRSNLSWQPEFECGSQALLPFVWQAHQTLFRLQVSVPKSPLSLKMPKSKPRKVFCGYGKRFIDSQSRSRHTRDSPLHQQPVTAVADTDTTPALAGESDETQELSTGKEIESVGRLYYQGDSWKGKGACCCNQDSQGHAYTIRDSYVQSSAG